jgi:hypothetical protein
MGHGQAGVPADQSAGHPGHHVFVESRKGKTWMPGIKPSKRVIRRRLCLEGRPVRAAILTLCGKAHAPASAIRLFGHTTQKGPVALCHRPQVPMSNETRGRTGSRDDLPAEQGGGSGPWEVKPEVAT